MMSSMRRPGWIFIQTTPGPKVYGRSRRAQPCGSGPFLPGGGGTSNCDGTDGDMVTSADTG